MPSRHSSSFDAHRVGGNTSGRPFSIVKVVFPLRIRLRGRRMKGLHLPDSFNGFSGQLYCTINIPAFVLLSISHFVTPPYLCDSELVTNEIGRRLVFGNTNALVDSVFFFHIDANDNTAFPLSRRRKRSSLPSQLGNSGQNGRRLQKPSVRETLHPR